MHKFRNKKLISLITALSMTTGVIALPAKVVKAVQASHVVISEVYGGGGNSGATLKNDFIELYNPTSQDIDLTGWRVEYASATGSFSTNNTNLVGTLKAGSYYLIQQSAGSGGTEVLPVPEVSGNIAMSGTNCKVRLVNNNGQVVDFVGIGTANESETAPSKAISNTTSAQRNDNDGSQTGSTNGWDTNNNSADFYIGTPTPRNSSYVVEEEVEGLVTIKEARESESGSTVKVKGIVTFKEESGTKFNYAIQDGTAGIALRGADGLSIGDEVIVEGTMSAFNGLTQIAYTLIDKKVEKGPLPEAKEVTIADILENNAGEAFESQRVKISDVTIGAVNTAGNTTLTDGNGKVLNIYKSPELPNIKEGDKVDVVGLLSQYNTYQLRIVHESQVVKVGEVVPPTPEEDKVGPVVENMNPRPSSAIGDNKRPEISATFTDATGVNMDSVKLSVDGVEIATEKLVKEGNTVKYTVEADLSEGKHTVAVEVKDTLDNVTTKEWYFTVGKQDKNLYFGQLHSHTNISDGQGSVDEAYTYAKNNAGLDFFAVTDHSNWFDNEMSASIADGSASAEWKQGLAAADKYNKDGEFTAIYGYEMSWSGSTGGYGHINTFNTPGFETRTNKNMDLKNYYNALKTQEQSVSQFNHPGKTFGDFSDFGLYDVQVDKLINLVEVGNGEGPVRGSGYFPSYEMYTRALDKGWHVAPSNNQDNHKGMWGNANTARTVVEATELTRDSIYEAIRENRVYSTEDNNLRISYEVNGNTMGSKLPETDNLTFKINVEDIDNGDNINKISIIGDGGKVIKSIDNINSTTKDWTFTLDSSNSSYYYVRVDQADKDIAVTAPVWVGEKENVGISSVKSDTEVVLAGENFNIETTIYNNEATDIKNVKVEYFLNGGETAIHTEVIENVVAAGTVVSKLPYKAENSGDYEFTVKVSMSVNGTEKVFTSKLALEVLNANEVSKVVIDGSHYNQYVTGNYAGKMTTFMDLVATNGGKPVLNMGTITDELLEGVSLLILTDPESKVDDKYGLKPSKYSAEELDAIKKYTDNGGNLIIASRADYGDATGEYQHSVQSNVVLEKIGATTRFNDDQVIDKTENGGQAYRLYFDDYNKESKWLQGVDLSKKYSFYSGCSVIVDKNNKNSEALVYGHATSESDDADKQGDNTPVNKGEIVGLAIETLSSGANVIVSGTSFLSDFEIDGDSAEQYSNRNLVNSLLGTLAPAPQLPVSKIADVRVDADGDNNPDRFGETVVVEGYVTAASNAAAKGNSFFDVIYVQDETAGLTVFGVSTTEVKLGQKVRLKGRVSSYLGDSQIALKNEGTDLEIIDEAINLVEPTKLSTKDSMLEAKEGLLVKVEGTVTRIEGQNIYVNDGSGESRVYTEGYIGSSTNPGVADEWKERVKVGDTVSAIGLASEDPEGHRLRVRDSAEIVVTEVAEETKELTIFHTNDVHSRVDNYAKVAGYVNSNTGSKMLLDMGDTYHGQSFATLENGSSIAKILKSMGYVAMAPGNHDFNYGQNRLAELSVESGVPVLAANVKKDGKPVYDDYMIKEVDGIKVGLFGLASPETAYKTNPNNVTGIDFGTMDSIVTDSQRIVDTLEDEGVDVIIALSHLGIDPTSEVKATDIGAAVEGIDLILDGHSHSTLPMYADFNANHDTKITSTGQYLEGVGEVKITFDDNKEIVDVELATVSVKDLTIEDETIKNLINEIKAEQQPILDVVVGQTPILLDGLRAHVRGGHTNLGRLITSAILDETGADIAFTNGGGIRDSIQVGDITKGDVIKVLPFGNYIVTKKVKGQDIIDALNFGMVDQSGGFPHFAGMTVDAEKYTDEAGKVRWKVISAKVNGEALDVNKEYVLATNDFIAVGGDGYEMFKKYPTLNEYSALDEALISYIDKVGAEGIEAIDKEIRLKEVDLAVLNVEELINKIPTFITLADKTTIEVARTAFEALTEEKKALVSNLEKLISAEARIAELEEAETQKENYKVADKVMSLINKISNEVTLKDKKTIESARAEYDKLTDIQKGLVTNLNKLEAAENKLVELEELEANQQAADIVIKLIDKISKKVTIKDKSQVEAARAAYESLSDAQKALVTNLDKLEAAEDIIEGLGKATASLIRFVA